MNGKRLFKGIKCPQDLYKLPSEIVRKRDTTAVFDLDRALAAREGKDLKQFGAKENKALTKLLKNG